MISIRNIQSVTVIFNVKEKGEKKIVLSLSGEVSTLMNIIETCNAMKSISEFYVGKYSYSY